MQRSEQRDLTTLARPWQAASMGTRRGVAAGGAGGVLAALLLLGVFHSVMAQAMQRAQLHWAPVQQADPAGCAPASAAQPGSACDAGQTPR